MEKEKRPYSKQYYLTSRGIKIELNNPKYVPEEKEIIDILKDGRKSINKIKEEINKNLEINRSWKYVENLLDNFLREEIVNVIE